MEFLLTFHDVQFLTVVYSFDSSAAVEVFVLWCYIAHIPQGCCSASDAAERALKQAAELCC